MAIKLKIFVCLAMIVIFNFVQADPASNEKGHQRKKALIFGVSGQDGYYLTEFLLNKNYEVHGVKRASSSLHSDRLFQDTHFSIHNGDLQDSAAIFRLVQKIQPDEIYNLAAQSQVKASFEFPEYTAEIDALGTLRILEAIRLAGLSDKTRFYQASSSEMFGVVQESPQTERTPFLPRSPYSIAKLYAYWITINYRESFNIFACNGILFNHESPMRSEKFVTRKITLAACRYKLGLQDVLYLGNLNAKRDWGYAKDYVEAMWLMLQQSKPEDFVIATGETHSVRDFVELAFKELGIDIEWHGEGTNEYAIDKSNGKTIVKIDPSYYRPTEVDLVLGNAEKAEKVLGWKPKTSFQELLKIMINSDYEKIFIEKKLLQFKNVS